MLLLELHQNGRIFHFDQSTRGNVCFKEAIFDLLYATIPQM